MAGTGRIGCTSGGALSELTGPRPDALGGQENAAGLGDRQSPRVPESRLRGLVSFAR